MLADTPPPCVFCFGLEGCGARCREQCRGGRAVAVFQLIWPELRRRLDAMGPA